MLHTHTQKERVKEKGKIVNFVNVNFENQSAKLARCSLQSDLKREREKKIFAWAIDFNYSTHIVAHRR